MDEPKIYTEYSCLSDRSLISRYRSGEEAACAALLARYANLINRRIRGMGLTPPESDDAKQEAYMGLYNAIRSYDPEKNTSFSSFAGLCVENSLKNFFAAASTKKALANSSALPIDELSLPEPENANPEEILLDKEACASLRALIGGVLSDFERQVLFCYLNGRGYAETAGRLHTSQKSVDNALQRARRKLRAVLDKL